jgi:ATP-dependent DNA helicase RecG
MSQRKTDDQKMALLGYHSPAEYPLHIPEGYHDYTKPKEFVAHQIGQGKQLFKLSLMRDPDINDRKTPHIIKLFLKDKKGMISCTLFGHKFVVRGLSRGDEIYIKGEAIRDDFGNLIIKSPEIINKRFANKIVPRYRGKTEKDDTDQEGKKRRAVIKEERVFELVRDQAYNNPLATIEHILKSIDDTEENILKATGLGFTSLAQWIRELHFPQTMYEAQRATEMSYRIAAHEVYLRAQRMNNMVRETCPDSAFNIDRESVVKRIKSLPFDLTRDQLVAITDIVKDIRSDRPMYRLLSGDVGVGKTLAFLIPAIAAREEGAKVGIMMPNIALCANLYHELTKNFPDVPVLHLRKGIRKKEVVLDNNPIIIGTQTLLFGKTSHLKDWSPDLFVVDEQQKMSREQRERLLEDKTNFLEATATAIPQTLAMVTHGGMDYSSIQKCPVEKSIHTQLVVGQADGYKAMQDALKQVIRNGDQAALIYPLVTSDDENARSVEQRFEQFNKLFPGRVAMLHGKMKDDEKMQVIEDMKAGKFDFLISSTVIEVGITIPSVRFLGVVEPDRYGTSTLHQMRGRVARNGGEGSFWMYKPESDTVSCEDDLNPETLDRLRLLEKFKHNEGFELSMADMELRGFGNFLSEDEKQSGKSVTLFQNIRLMPVHLRKYKEQQTMELVKERNITIKRKSIDEVNVQAASTLSI